MHKAVKRPSPVHATIASSGPHQPKSWSLLSFAQSSATIIAPTDSTPSTERSMLPIKMMKVDPMARISGMAAELARPQTRLRKVKKLGLSEAEDKRKADQYDQRPKLSEPAIRRTMR